MLRETHNELWQSFINGDNRALKLLYTEFSDKLYGFGMRFTTDTELVKDGIQDLFVDLFKYRQSLAAEVNVKSYLFTSLKRKVCLVLKKNAAEVNKSFEIPFVFSGSTEERIIHEEYQSELVAKLNTQLEQLPSRQKEALYLRFNSELDYEEIAVIMNISIETCRKLVYRAVKQLRERMTAGQIYKIMA